ncbi:hypothetical protein TH47_20795 [Thalassospira sp. MCCC 1A02803]|nr:hypothetical protein AUQ41_12730 [Thalassospira sp. MCCC 1A02898]ONH85668.1 hypothetical protein TH47_20795 [Thalassospira sp. MCCC 1A02803]
MAIPMIRAVLKVWLRLSIFALWQIEFEQTVTDKTQFANGAKLLSIYDGATIQNRPCINDLMGPVSGVNAQGMCKQSVSNEPDCPYLFSNENRGLCKMLIGLLRLDFAGVSAFCCENLTFRYHHSRFLFQPAET